jgi:trans-aconitate 2-methyltransferase
MLWSAHQYTRFENERTRPVHDLLAQLPTRPVANAVDIGCGPGNSTELLARRYPQAVVTGLDSSAEMIEAARKRLPDVHFELGDIATWQAPENQFDLILANAVLQWLPHHGSLLPALLGKLAKGGSLAAQIPDNLSEPTHRLMREIAGDVSWVHKLSGVLEARGVRQGADWYYRALRKSGATVNIWLTTYYHPLDGADAVVEWFKGSGLRPFLEPLTATERSAFLIRYRAAIEQAYPVLEDGTVLLAFPRLFFIATR